MYYTVSGGAPLFVTRHPDHIHQVLVEEASAFAKRSEDLEPFLGDGLLNANGDTWRRQRRRIQPAFRRDRIAAYGEIFAECAQRRCAQLMGQPVELAAEMTALTLEIVCKTLFDHDVDGNTEALAGAIDEIQNGLTDPIPNWVPTFSRGRRRRAFRTLDATMSALVEEKRQQSTPGQDMLSQLVHLSDGEAQLTPKQLRDELVTFFVAGHETTSLALTWALLLIGESPEVEAQLHDELDRVLSGPPTFADLDALVYTEQVLNEAMRLYPPAYAVPRLAIAETSVGGYRLRPGDEIVAWIFHCHRDSRWFDQPDRFDPGRFDPSRVERSTPHAFIPFGAGQRTCIGRHFAMFEAKIILATLARAARWVRQDHHPVGLRPRITLSPNVPIRMRVQPR